MASKAAATPQPEPLDSTEVLEVVEADEHDLEEEADAQAQVEDDVEGSLVVRYQGFPFEERSITRADWSRVGIDHDDTTWDKSNNWTVRSDELDFLSEEQFDAYIRRDPKFVIEEA